MRLWQGAAPLVGFPNATSSLNGNCSAAPGWRACVSNPENCTSTEMVAMNDWMDDYVGTLNATKTFHAPGNGAFIHSCHVNPQSALHQWWVYFEQIACVYTGALRRYRRRLGRLQDRRRYDGVCWSSVVELRRHGRSGEAHPAALPLQHGLIPAGVQSHVPEPSDALRDVQKYANQNLRLIRLIYSVP